MARGRGPRTKPQCLTVQAKEQTAGASVAVVRVDRAQITESTALAREGGSYIWRGKQSQVAT